MNRPNEHFLCIGGMITFTALRQLAPRIANADAFIRAGLPGETPSTRPSCSDCARVDDFRNLDALARHLHHRVLGNGHLVLGFDDFLADYRLDDVESTLAGFDLPFERRCVLDTRRGIVNVRTFRPDLFRDRPNEFTFTEHGGDPNIPLTDAFEAMHDYDVLVHLHRLRMASVNPLPILRGEFLPKFEPA